MKRAWTPSQVKEVLRLHFQGVRRKEIARRMNRTDWAIKSVIERGKDNYRARNQNEKSVSLTSKQQQFVKLFSQPHTHEQVAATMGVRVETSRTEKHRLSQKGYHFPAAQDIRLTKKKYKQPKKLPRIKISTMSENSRYFEEDQAYFILKMGNMTARVKKIYGRYPTDLEVLQEAIRLGYRLVEKEVELPRIRKE